MSKYVLDANVFIEAKNRYYGFEICPGFWTSLIDLNKSKHVYCIDRIRDELVAQNDDIKDWVENRSPEEFFKKTKTKPFSIRFKRWSIGFMLNLNSSKLRRRSLHQ